MCDYYGDRKGPGLEVVMVRVVIGRTIVEGRNRVEEGDCTGYNDCTVNK